jgi:ApbE superfamily uncharacterized protein (UPF0280 family)
MTIIRNTEQPEARETYEDAVKRHRQQLEGTLKKKSALVRVAKFLAAADCQRGLVAPPNV